MVLVGASAISCFMRMYWRGTNDLDLTVAADVDDCVRVLSELSGWTNQHAAEQRWVSPEGILVDILPAAQALSDAQGLVWPRSGMTMSLIGFRLAFEEARKVTLDPEVIIEAAPPEVIFILKTVSFVDRPYERTRDLTDLAYIMEYFIPLDDDRRFASDILEMGMQVDDVSPYLLGRRVGELARNSEARAVEDFFSLLTTGTKAGGHQAALAQKAPLQWRTDPGAVEARFDAFRRGMEAGKSLRSSSGP